MNWTSLLFIRVRQAHQDLQDVEGPEEVPSVHFLCSFLLHWPYAIIVDCRKSTLLPKNSSSDFTIKRSTCYEQGSTGGVGPAGPAGFHGTSVSKQ